MQKGNIPPFDFLNENEGNGITQKREGGIRREVTGIKGHWRTIERHKARKEGEEGKGVRGKRVEEGSKEGRGGRGRERK